uniref:Uncharacterized protein n=1 Tax=viral metagenome TaxID=1070528 RepID=A0A6C0JZP8_9ZZZZ
MNIDCNCEFGYELQLVIPYAYYLHKNGLLKQTTSSIHTNELYYFSKNHNAKYHKRIFNNPNVPNRTPHVNELNYLEWTPPPYKHIFKNDIFLYEKPLLIIHNKFNQELRLNPVNYINTETLDAIFTLCKHKYTIVYIRPKQVNIVSDNSEIYNLEEDELLRSHEVIDANTLYEENKSVGNFNHFQLLLHSNCNKFISVQGGNCVLASYFGGTNIIYTKRGNELLCDAYNGHYKQYSNCNILHTDNYELLLDLITHNYCD